MTMNDDKISEADSTSIDAIAVITKPHGVHGELKVHPLIDWSALPDEVTRLYVSQDEGKHEAVAVESIRNQGQGLILKLKGIGDRDAAEAMRGKYLYAPEAKNTRDEAMDGAQHVVGLDVFDTTGTFLGKIEDVMSMPAHEVYVVRDGERDHLIPAVPEFIRSVDFEGGAVTVKVIEGLLEEA